MPISPSVHRASARVARLYAHGTPDPVEEASARRELKEAKLTQAIQRAIDSVPPFTDEQRERLASLLRTGR